MKPRIFRLPGATRDRFRCQAEASLRHTQSHDMSQGHITEYPFLGNPCITSGLGWPVCRANLARKIFLSLRKAQFNCFSRSDLLTCMLPRTSTKYFLSHGKSSSSLCSGSDLLTCMLPTHTLSVDYLGDLSAFCGKPSNFGGRQLLRSMLQKSYDLFKSYGLYFSQLRYKIAYKKLFWNVPEVFRPFFSELQSHDRICTAPV